MTRWTGSCRLAALVVGLIAVSSCAAGSLDEGSTSRRIDLLAAACARQDFNACDELAVAEDAPASARSFGATCGDLRSTPGGSCLDLLTSTATAGPSAEAGCLSTGARGNAVRDLQQRLNAAGADPPLVVDGEFGRRTAKAVEDKLGKPAFCPSDSQRLERQQAEFVEVPDVRRQPQEEAVVLLEAVDLTAVTASQCSDLVEAGAVVAVRYERSDGMLLTVYDAEAPVNSETNLISPDALIELVVSDGSCQGAQPSD